MKKILLLMPFVSLLACVFGGTLSETDTAYGTVRRANGDVVAGASVKLHPQTSDGKVRLGKRASRPSCDSVKTDNDGYFIFESLQPGVYVIEINERDFFGAIIKVTFDSLKQTKEVGAVLDTLGCVSGELDPSDSIVIKGAAFYLPEIHRVARLDSDGRFFIPSLPAWNYRYSTAIGDSIARELPDSVRISVLAGDTTRIVGFDSESGIIDLGGTIIERPGN
jgi:hypothetical protein